MPVCAPEKSPLDPALFEALCRAAATRLQVPSFCRRRRCRRGDFCEGKLEPRAIPPCFRGPKEACVRLPACMAGADDHWFGEFVLEWILCHEDYFGLVRAPEAVRNLLRLDGHWPVFGHDGEDAYISVLEGDVRTRAEKMIAAYSGSMSEIGREHEAALLAMKSGDQRRVT